MTDTSDFACAFETKAAGASVASFSGVASTDALDLAGDVVESGAFLPIALKASGAPDVLMLRDHDRTQIIGGWTRIEQQSRELHVEGELCLAVPKARETYILMKRGHLSGLSVGFMPGAVKREGERRRILKGALMEISVVAMPANRGARVIAVKSWLEALGLSSAEAEMAAQEGFGSVFRARELRSELMSLIALMRQ